MSRKKGKLTADHGISNIQGINDKYVGKRVRAPLLENAKEWVAGTVTAVHVRADSYIILIVWDGCNAHNCRQNKALLQ